MRLRRYKVIEQISAPETATPAGIHGLLVEIRDLFRRILRVAKWILAGAAVLIVCASALQLQVSSRNEDIRQTKVTATEAKDAARDAKRAVEDAIAQSQGGSFDQQKFLEAFNALVRVEQYVCGGPCPESTSGG